MGPESTTLHETARAVALAVGDLRARSARYIALLRLMGAAGFLALAAFLGLLRGLHDWRAAVPVHAAYAALAGAIVLALRAGKLRTAVSALAPIADVAMVYWLQRASLWISPFPAGVAGWSLGPFVLLVIFSSLTLRPRLIYGTAIAACLAEGALQLEVGVSAGAVIASAAVLLLSAVTTHWAARRIEAMVATLVAEEVQLRLVTEKSEELGRANEATAAARARLAEQHDKLLNAQREAETLTSLLVHDMKGPLTSLLMMVEYARSQVASRADGHKLARDLLTAEGQGRRLLAMIHDLLAVARLEKGSLQPRKTPVAVPSLCEGIVAAYGPDAAARRSSIAAAFDGPVVASVDRELVQRALENLITNALAHVGPGDRIEVFGSAAGAEVVLGVRNSGPGIPAEARSRLFERSGGSGRGRANAGLGLYFCKLVAMAHGGSIALEEQQGWDVVFALRFPVDVVSAVAA
jgi:signal transduction histidine kinase